MVLDSGKFYRCFFFNNRTPTIAFKPSETRHSTTISPPIAFQTMGDAPRHNHFTTHRISNHVRRATALRRAMARLYIEIKKILFLSMNHLNKKL